MKRLFIETDLFKNRLDSLQDNTLLQLIENEILKSPESGKLIPGLGGLRKIRIGDKVRGKGKRGGYRVIYLDISQKGKTYLLWMYGKGEVEDISSDEKRVIRKLVDDLKK